METDTMGDRLDAVKTELEDWRATIFKANPQNDIQRAVLWVSQTAVRGFAP